MELEAEALAQLFSAGGSWAPVLLIAWAELRLRPWVLAIADVVGVDHAAVAAARRPFRLHKRPLGAKPTKPPEPFNPTESKSA